jgi:ELWxxDGT repeat protein
VLNRFKCSIFLVGGLSALLALAPPVQAQRAYQVEDTAPGSTSAPLGGFGVLGGKVYFAGTDAANGTELWQSDGTPGGTSLLKDIWTGPGPGNPAQFTRVGNTLFFTRIYDYLVKTDGTAEGTVEVHGFSYCRSLTNVAGTLFMAADVGNGSGNELWKSDGTDAGTVLVKDIRPVPGESGLVIGAPLAAVGNTVFFVANDGATGDELWKSDGTAAGTVLVKDIRPGTDSGVSIGILSYLTNVNGTLFFAANDGTNGVELWKSDGTAAGTVMVKDINTFSDSNPNQLLNIGGTLYFTAADPFLGSELHKSDGTTAGTVNVKDIYPGGLSANPSNFTNVNGTLFFSAGNAANGTELWKSNGTDAGTVLVRDINPGAGHSMTYEPFERRTLVVGNRMLFRATDGTSGVELWRTDGTAAGTFRMHDVRPGALDSTPTYLTRSGSLVFFAANDGTTGIEPWATNVNEDRSVDFFGDRKADLTVFNASSGLWYIRDSRTSTVVSLGYGGSGYSPAPGDYDGDSTTDIAVYHPPTSLWFIRSSATLTSSTTHSGTNGSAPVRGDFDGDGKTDLASVYHPTGTWSIRSSSTGATTTVAFGGPGYTTVPGDYDGDGKTDLGVYHPPSGLWFVRNSSTGTDTATGFGGTCYAPVRGDFDGDAKNDLAVFHDASGLWFIKHSTTGAVATIGFGGSGYTPVPENYDGDGMTDLAMYHPPSGLWYMRSSLNGGTTTAIGFGGPGYDPVN